MLRLFYVSTASPSFRDGDVNLLVEKAERRNRERGITGALVFNGVNFGQVLEGEDETVLDLMDLIRNDVRHDGVIVVQQRQVDDRAYGGWGMKRVEGLKFDELVEAMAQA